MPECRSCDKSIAADSNFCQHCGAPQNRRAAEALESYVKRQIRSLSQEELDEITGGETGDELTDRISYAVGWATLVTGLAVLPQIAIASGFLLFGGLISLPPIRRLIGRTLGNTPGIRPTALLYLTSVGTGVALFFVAGG